MSCRKPFAGQPAVFSPVPAISSALMTVCLGTGAAAFATEPAISTTIFTDHYVLSGVRIDHLDVLERSVSEMPRQVVRLQACGSTAERAQRAAAHRLRNLDIELRWLPPDSRQCRLQHGLPMPAAMPEGPGPFGIDDESVDRWWHEQMP